MKTNKEDLVYLVYVMYHGTVPSLCRREVAETSIEQWIHFRKEAIALAQTLPANQHLTNTVRFEHDHRCTGAVALEFVIGMYISEIDPVQQKYQKALSKQIDYMNEEEKWKESLLTEEETEDDYTEGRDK